MKRNYQREVESELLDIDARLHLHTCGYVGLRKEKYPLYVVLSTPGQDLMEKDSSPASSSRQSHLSSSPPTSIPTVLITAGIHGDEPAGVYAVIEFMKNHISDYLAQFRFLIFPCLNPWGFEHDKRENVHGVDINRSFLKNNTGVARLMRDIVRSSSPYALAINLHEDDPSVPVLHFPLEINPNGFYLYETSLNGRSIGQPMIRILREQGVKISNRATIYGEGTQNGVIYCRSTSGELEQFLQRFTSTILTPETDASLPLEKRVDAHLCTLRAALDCL